MDTVRKIKILIVDDHDLVRHSLTVMFRVFADFEVVGETGDGRIALALCAAYHPDVVLMDLLMPLMDGVTATQLIHDKSPNITIVALTSSADGALVQAALNAGAVRYLLKTGSIDEVADAVRKAYYGKPTLSQEAVNVLISKIQHPPKTEYHLTKRERGVLALMVEGLNNRQIAQRLSISQSTVKNHVMSIYSKLNTASRTQAVALALQQKLLAKN